MRIRSFTRDPRRRSRSPWPARVAWAVIGVAAVIFLLVVVNNLQRHDALVQWRTELEAAAGSPAWPEWSSTWPELPVPRRRHRMPGNLRGPYAYAASQREVLQHIPCYCGCADEGHGSNLNCFVKQFRSDGTPVWTDHSFNCEMCVHIAREVMLMSSMGMSLTDIRGVIDHRYAQASRPPTRTPVPSQPAREGQ